MTPSKQESPLTTTNFCILDLIEKYGSHTDFTLDFTHHTLYKLIMAFVETFKSDKRLDLKICKSVKTQSQ